MSVEIPRDYLDRILRSLWARAPEKLLRLALGDPDLRVTGSLDSQPALIRRGVDAVALASSEGGPFVGHVEYQTDTDAGELAQRMALYGLLYHSLTGLPVRSAVLLLEPCDGLAEGLEIRHGDELLCLYRFRVLRLSQLPAEQLACDPDLAVLTPLGGGGSLGAVALARDTIIRQFSRPERGDLLAALYIVGGRRFDYATLLRIFSEEELMQSSTYQHLLEKGLSQGLSQGLAQGLSQGLAQGMAQGMAQGLSQGLAQGAVIGEVRGREQALRAVIDRQLTARFPEARLDDLLAHCSADDLDAFVDALLGANDESELRRWLLARLGQV